jgi:Ca2+-binding EF-hand superfamily protein
MKKTLVLLGCALVLPAFAATDLFAKMDANHDKRITAQEHAAAARAMFVTMDADKDGKVTAEEMTAAQPKVTGRKAGAGDMDSADKIKAIDADGDGVLTAKEHAGGSRAMFEKMDRNHDGKLTRGEFNAGHAKLMAHK